MSDTLLGSEPNLVAYWDMNEGQGLYSYDKAQYGNTGECFNGNWVAGFEPGMSSKDDMVGAAVPTTFRLAQNRPNPFSRSTTIPFAVPENADLHLKVYDLSGKLVTTLVDDTCVPGYHVTIWEGTNSKGKDVPSGLYICRMTSGSFKENRKLLLLR
jgi:hypothetical protein